MEDNTYTLAVFFDGIRPGSTDYQLLDPRGHAVMDVTTYEWLASPDDGGVAMARACAALVGADEADVQIQYEAEA